MLRRYLSDKHLGTIMNSLHQSVDFWTNTKAQHGPETAIHRIADDQIKSYSETLKLVLEIYEEDV